MKQNNSISSRLSWSVAGTTLMFAVAMAFALAIFDLWRADHSDRDEIEKHFELIQASSVEPMAEALWNYNRPVLTLIGEGVIRQPNVNKVAVFERDRAIVDLGTKVYAEITRDYPLMHGSVQLGHMVVAIDPQSIRRLTLNRFGASLFSNLILTLCIAAFVMYVIERKVMRYVRQAATFVNRRSSSNLSEVLEFDRSTSRASDDELDFLAAGFSSMQAKLARSIDSLERDIVRREALEFELQKSESRLSAVFQGSPIGISVTRLVDNVIIEVNQHALNMLGFAAHEVVGKSALELGVYPNPTQFVEGRRQLIENGRVEWLNLAWRKKNGELCDVELNASLIDIRGEPHMVAMWTDVTERKRLNQELDQHRNHLETLIDLRTAELAEAKDKAEAANRAKSLFLSNMSHELRTPLNAILGFANLLQRDKQMDEDSRKKLLTINRAGQHLLALINDVLEISRIESGRVVIANEAFDLEELVIGVEELIRVRSQAKGLAFSVRIEADVPRHAKGDARRLRQVLINLLGNAVKYTDQGIVELHVRRRAEQICFVVTDSGAGIASEELPHIFEKFYQTEAGATKGDGTGLGLAISQEYSTLMGGHLSVSSELGRGSVFALEVQLGEAPAAVAITRPGRVLGLLGTDQELRVLVVDDDADSAEFMRQLLGNVGFVVRTATNGAHAVECFQQWRPCFIWMDMRMPVMDGYEATQRIRSLPGGEAVKIVALTASAFEEDRDKILSIGCDDLVRKPTEDEQLFTLMADLLGLQYRYAEPTAPESEFAVELEKVDPAVVAELLAAAKALDLGGSLRIVAGLRDTQMDSARALEQMLRRFRFDLVVKLCEESVGTFQ